MASQTSIKVKEKYIAFFKKIVENSHDTFSLFQKHNDQTVYEPRTFEEYPQSPTAQRYRKACDKCNTAWSIIHEYKQEKVENDEDCEYLQPAFHSFSRAHMCEAYVFNMKGPTKEVTCLLDQYLKLRPTDVLAKYLQVIMIMLEPRIKPNNNKRSDYTMVKNVIVAAEKFANEMEKMDELELKKDILTDHYYQLGTIYSATNQTLRALDSFQKSFDNDKNNYLALFGIAYHLRYREPSKAVELFEKYMKIAPKCDKLYHDAFYTLAVIYFTHYDNKDEAFRYADLGDKHYDKRLPFLQPSETASKTFMEIVRTKVKEKK